MAGPVYQLWMARPKEAWYQLSEEERRIQGTKHDEILEKFGVKRVIRCFSGWATEEWGSFGVLEFPDIEAVQKKTQALWEIGHYRYFESVTMLGIKMEEESS
jgi:hypothetical protein